MKSSFAVAIVAGVASAIDIDELKFMNYLSKYGKHYDSIEEFVVRKEIFLAKELKIAAHNARPSNFSMGHNKFSDWKPEEMAKLLGEKESAESNAYCKPPDAAAAPNGGLPDYVNWAEAGMTTPIKD